MLLECATLHAAYSGAQALRGASLGIDKGEIVGLCGPNKAGKSTIVRCIAGLKPQPTIGKVCWDGSSLTGLSPVARLQLGISVCPEGRGIYRELSVRRNFELGAGNVGKAELEAKISRVLTFFPELKERLRQRAGTLSGGEAQMLGIARKLLRETRLLVLDEPSLGLAPKMIERVFGIVRQIRDQSGVAVLLVEEGLNRLDRWVDRCYVLSRGVVVADGTPSELARRPDVQAAFVGRLGRAHVGQQ